MKPSIWKFRFLEDGDLHTDNKRQRQFKWKGLDDSLEIDRRVSDGEEEGDEGAEEGELWRIQRLEREKWMKGNFAHSFKNHFPSNFSANLGYHIFPNNNSHCFITFFGMPKKNDFS